jgi:hypothetical protein
MILRREPVEVETSLGRVNAKKITTPDGRTRTMPEYDDCKRKAQEHKLPFYQVYERILAESNCIE